MNTRRSAISWTAIGTNDYPRFASAELSLSRPVLWTCNRKLEANMGRGILLWLLGVPIPVIILLWLFFR